MLVMLPSCLVKCAQSLGQLVLQRLASRRALCPEIFPADARDAPLLPRQMRAVTVQKYSQLMLVMLPSCLVKCAQSLGQLVLQRLASRRALCPEIFPADARDAPLRPRQMRAHRHVTVQQHKMD